MKYKLISFLLAWIFPTKKDRKTFRKFCQKLEMQNAGIKAQKHYNKIVKKLHNKKRNGEKLRVAFIVSENQKWGYQSLYDLLEKSNIFEPIILISLLTSVHKGIDNTRKNTIQNYNFFKNKNMNVEFLYENNNYKALREFKPDIVFYEQPWDLPLKYTPQQVSKYALTCFCSYSFETLNDSDNYFNNFHGFLYKYFIEHKLNLARYEKYSPIANKNCVVIGYPKLDSYKKHKKIWNNDKIKIIYAPHHSFDNTLKLATFDKNAQFILDLAKRHPETTWLFKPHPRLKFALLKTGIMTEDEIDKYYAEWEKIGQIHTQGDYIDYFVDSDLMITDCLSFLAEYLPSGKPLIRLINDKSKHLNSLGEKVVSEYYNAHSNLELEYLFNEIVTKKNDYKKEKRVQLINEIIDYDKTASEKIYDYLLNILN